MTSPAMKSPSLRRATALRERIAIFSLDNEQFWRRAVPVRLSAFGAKRTWAATSSRRPAEYTAVEAGWDSKMRDELRMDYIERLKHAALFVRARNIGAQ
jgi:hypothetical protein